MHEVMQRIITGLIFGSLFVTTFLYAPPYMFSLLLTGVLGEILVIEWPTFIAKNRLYWPVSLVYPIAPFAFLIYMNHHTAGRFLLVVLFISVWSYDSGAYCIGKWMGTHKIFPQISPGKTWEGFFGGIAFCIFSLTLLWWYYAISCTCPKLIFLGIVMSTLATTGDLFESWLKRKSGIKDSGSILPGHGGFLDRFDGVLFASIPLFVYCFFWLNS